MYSFKNVELLIDGSGTAAGSNKGTVIWFVSTSWNMRASNMDWSLNPLLWSVSVSTKKISCMILRKYCWKKAFETAISAPAKLLMTSRHTAQRSVIERRAHEVDAQFNPISAISRIVCLIAQIILSINSLNCCGGTVSNATGRHEYLRHYDADSMPLTREAVEVDRPQQFEEAGTVFGELGEVLVDHVERRLKHGVEDSRNLGCKQWLPRDR